MLAVLAAAIAIIVTAPPTGSWYSQTAGEEWSFERYPPTPKGGLSREQISKRFSVGGNYDLDLRDLNCTRRLDNLIELYVEIYPRFERFAGDEEWRRRWVEAFALTTYVDSLDCLFLNDVMAVLVPENLEARSDYYEFPYFCGQYSDHPVSKPVEQAVRQMVWLAFENDSANAAAQLVSFGRAFSGPISLNPDAMLYLAQRFAWLESNGRPASVAGFMQREFDFRKYELTPARRAEVIAAAHRGDAEAILSTTAPCKPYQAMKDSRQ